MSETTSSDQGYRGPSRTWVGWVFFGAMMMLLAGFYQVMVGFVALFDDSYFAVTADGVLTSVDYTVWGLVHMGIGLVAIVTGFGVMLAQRWARVIGVILAVMSVLVNVAFLAAYPVWSVSIIVIDVIAIYALIVHGAEVEDAVDL
jgi:hypothetical protein